MLSYIHPAACEYSRFRRLSLKFHPEKNKAPGAEKKFDEVAEAYDILSHCKLGVLHSISFNLAFSPTQLREKQGMISMVKKALEVEFPQQTKNFLMDMFSMEIPKKCLKSFLEEKIPFQVRKLA